MKRITSIALVVLAACGGKIEDSAVTDGTSSSGGASPSPTATGTSTWVPPSPGQPGPTPTPPPPRPNPASQKIITAQAQLGGLDRIAVFAADPAADSCVRIELVSPGYKGDYPNVLTPKPWTVQQITRSPGANRCGGGKQPPAAEDADDAKGSISFASKQGSFPCSIDVHVSAIFADKPTLEQIDGDKIAVAGCK